jgi:hypothetical protein
MSPISSTTTSVQRIKFFTDMDKFEFQPKEYVLCYHGPLMYEAKVDQFN